MNEPKLTDVQAMDNHTLILTYGMDEKRVFDVSSYITPHELYESSKAK
ncbi:MAG: hypothetical protein FWB74_06620 [Defluviitaleaceae bacterium]|nr:hypothetical protein [Defluviitaleaceae bacterium]